MSELAVKGCTISITSGQEASAKLITSQPSDKVLVGSNGVYFGDMTVKLTSVVQGAFVCEEAELTIKGMASNVLNSDDEKAVQKGDNASDNFTFKNPQGATQSFLVRIEITDAGQTDVIAT